MAFVYWIHLAEHTDITTSGYIGFTSKTAEGRFKKHRKDSFQKNQRKYTLHHAIRKYDSQLQITTLVEGSDEYCLLIEEKLRPSESIGWNQVRGGGAPNLGRKLNPEVIDKMRIRMKGNQYAVGNVHEESVKKRISEANKGNKHTLGYKFSEEHREAQSARMKGVQRSLGHRHTEEARKNMSDSSAKKWNHTKASKIWLHCVEIFDVFLAGESVSPLIPKLNVSRSSVFRMAERFRNGWNPNEDQEYLSWLEEKKGKQCHMN